MLKAERARPVRDEIGPSGEATVWPLAEHARGRVRDYLHLTKARLSLTVVLSGIVGYWLGASAIDPAHLLWFTGGTLLVVGAANAFNQILERELDALMVRTAQRPLPKGRIGLREAGFFSATAAALGLAILFTRSGLLAGVLGLAALGIYVLVYTPMKRRSAWCTAAGAVAGAVPTLMGYGAAAGGLGAAAWCLFGVVFFWQFPHTWAIAAAYREDYERVGYRALPRRRVAIQVVLMSAALVATSLLPAVFGTASAAYTAGALFLGASFLVVAVRFGDGSRRVRASALLGASLLYLPLILALTAFSGAGS